MAGETVTDPAELRKQLHDTSATGLAYECDEAVLGESSVAGAVFDATGLAVGAVPVVIPTNEWPASDSAIEARTISRGLGAVQWPVIPTT